MLRHLTISNIALIDKLSLDFEEGFSALTGETGAGKSILIEAAWPSGSVPIGRASAPAPRRGRWRPCSP